MNKQLLKCCVFWDVMLCHLVSGSHMRDHRVKQAKDIPING